MRRLTLVLPGCPKMMIEDGKEGTIKKSVNHWGKGREKIR
jgi:hypothetical protein